MTKIKCICFIGMLYICTSLSAGNATYLVHSYTDNVKIKPRGNSSWCAIHSQQILKPLDSIRVSKGSKIVLVDQQTNTTYVWQKPLLSTIRGLVQKSKESSGNMLVALSKQLFLNAAGKGIQLSEHDIYGTTMRDLDMGVMTINDSVACLIESISSQLLQGTASFSQDLTLLTTERDGLLYFMIDNHSSTNYCCNILQINRATHMVSLGIIPSPELHPSVLLVPCGQKLDLFMYPFLQDAQSTYLLFATPVIYSPAEVQELLAYPEDLQCEGIILPYVLVQ